MTSIDFMINGAQCSRGNVETGFEDKELGVNFLEEVYDYQPIFEHRGTKRAHSEASFEPLAPMAKMAKTQFVNSVLDDCYLSMDDLMQEFFIPKAHPVQEQSILMVEQPQQVLYVQQTKPTTIVRKEVAGKPKRKRVINREKTVFQYPHLVALCLLNSPNEVATAAMIYEFIEYHFPSTTFGGSWKSTLRHALAEKYGFCMNKLTDNGKSFYWAFIPERRSGLIKEIHDKIDENEGSMEKLRMRNIDDLPALLSGTFSRNRTAGANHPVPNVVRPISTVRMGQVNARRPVIHNQAPFPGFIHQNYWNYHQMPPPSFNPNYSIPYTAYQSLQYQNYQYPDQQFIMANNIHPRYLQPYRPNEQVQLEYPNNL